MNLPSVHFLTKTINLYRNMNSKMELYCCSVLDFVSHVCCVFFVELESGVGRWAPLLDSGKFPLFHFDSKCNC